MDKQEAIKKLRSADVETPEKMSVWEDFKSQFTTDDLGEIYRKVPNKINDEIFRLLHSPNHRGSKAYDILLGIISVRTC